MAHGHGCDGARSCGGIGAGRLARARVDVVLGMAGLVIKGPRRNETGNGRRVLMPHEIY